jgi:demethylmenaquinone methyltransferase/2-methoxy-6-polyprenyl-1,4-benzoquinol methylase
MTPTDEERAQPASQDATPEPHAADGAGPDRRRDEQVAAMFDEIAPVYDRLSRIVSFGRDRRWRAAAVGATGAVAGDAVVDVFAGTGRLAAMLADQVGPFGRVVAVDLSPRMVERGTATTRDLVQLEFVLADALALPFEDGRFDAATVSFGLRTLPDMVAGLAEMRRVVRPGGRVVCLERVMPRPLVWGRVYRAAVKRLVPLTGAMAGRRDAYTRLAGSLDHVPEVSAVMDAMRSAGLVEVTHRRFWLGAVALHVGTVPPSG